MNIRLEDLPVSIHQLVEIIGMEKMMEVIKCYGGASVYIPKYNTMVRYAKANQVAKEYDGKNGRVLMNKYGMTYSQLQYALKKEKIK